MGLAIKQIMIFYGMAGLAACQAQKPTEDIYTPDKIASTSLCGDTYLQAFAPDRISALSWQSKSVLSRANKAQKDFPQIRANIESVLPYSQDWILFGPGEANQQTTTLPYSLELNWVEGFEGVAENARYILKNLSLSDNEVEIWTAKIDALKSTGKDIRHSGQAPKILYLSRAGGSAGPNTFVNAVIEAAGGTNANPITGWHSPNIETFLNYEADIILSSFNGGNYHSRSDMHNPVLQDYIQSKTVIEISGEYWPCAGPGLLEATQILQKGILKWGARHDA